MDFLEHAFKGSAKKEYNIEYYKTHKDKWKKTLKEQQSSSKKLRRNIKTSKKEGDIKTRRAQQMAHNEMAKSIAQSRKVYKKYARKFNIANAANLIESGLNFLDRWLQSGHKY